MDYGGFPEDLIMAPAPSDLSFMNLIKQEINSPGSDPSLNTTAFQNGAQHQPPARVDFQAPPGAIEPRKGKKRPAAAAAETGSPGGSEESEKQKKNNGVVGLTELIDKIAAEKTALRFDDETKLYEVVDGPAFEARFQELRRTRSKRTNETATRPFSRMHVHYAIVRGERWAGTGTAFRAKDAVVDDFLDTEKIQANKINVTLMPSDGLAGFQITLQHFLNVTGAGDAYKRAMRAKEGDDSTPSTDDGTETVPEAPPMARDPSDDYWHSLSIDTVSEAINSVWSENSKGDQAYFFYREQRDVRFANGSVVQLVDGKLQADNTPSERAVYMVVSDDNAKWKGDPIPSAEQEKFGHWCCFLGQVPVRVKGAVKSGQYLGPARDGSGCACAATPGEGPVVGIALVGKDGEEEGLVRTMSFVGMNALNAGLGAQLTPLLAEGLVTQREVAELRLDLDETKKVVQEGIENLNERVDHIERQLEVSYTGYAVAGAGVPVTPRLGQLASPRVKGGWNSPREDMATRWKKPGTAVVGGKEVELRIMGDKLPSDEDLAEKGLGLYRAQSVGSPKEAGVCGLDNQRKTRAFIIGAVCVLFLGVVAAAFFIGWQSAHDFATGEDPMEAASASSSAEGSGADAPTSGNAVDLMGCNALTTMLECGGAAGCLWAEVESGEFAGLYACITAPEPDAGADANVSEQAPEEQGEQGVVVEGEEEVDEAEVECASVGSEAECQQAMLCTWDAAAGACGLGAAEMMVAECAALKELVDCEEVGGCEWREVEGGSGTFACLAQPKCGGLSSEEACADVDGCVWFKFGEKGNLCILDPGSGEP